MSCVVAIVGCPNAGKSTLFNRLVRKSEDQGNSLVHKEAGTTRDPVGMFKDFPEGWSLLDTAGLLEQKLTKPLQKQTYLLTQRSILNAAACLFMIDARVGVTAMDEEYGRWLHRNGCRVLPILNKCEARLVPSPAVYKQSVALGWGKPFCISAEHGDGVHELFLEMDNLFGRKHREYDAQSHKIEEMPALSFTVLGRPNTGKSTFINTLCREKRMLTSSLPGTTRDCVWSHVQWKGEPIHLCDTAGLLLGNSAKNFEHFDFKDIKKNIEHSLYRSSCVLLFLDATVPPVRNDVRLACWIKDSGRGLVIVLNKADLIGTQGMRIREKQLREMPWFHHEPIVSISGLKEQGFSNLHRTCQMIEKKWKKRISTSKLNQSLEQWKSMTPSRSTEGNPNLKFLSQTGVCPPQFTLVTGRVYPGENDRRYILRKIRETFNFSGVPLSLNIAHGQSKKS